MTPRIVVDKVRVAQIEMEFFEAICRTPGSATAMNRPAALGIFFDHWYKSALCHAFMFF